MTEHHKYYLTKCISEVAVEDLRLEIAVAVVTEMVAMIVAVAGAESVTLAIAALHYSYGCYYYNNKC